MGGFDMITPSNSQPDNFSDSAVAFQAVCVALAVDPDGPLAGILLIGISDIGKSSIALTLIEACPWQRTALVADDLVLLKANGAQMIARAPEKIQGLIEVRGYGPLPVKTQPQAIVRAAFMLTQEPQPRIGDERLWSVNPALMPIPSYTYQVVKSQAQPHSQTIRTLVRAILSGQTL